MGRRSARKAQRVRIVRRKPAVLLRDGLVAKVAAAPDAWRVVDEETGLELERFDEFKAAKDYCIRRDYDFGQFGRVKSRAKTQGAGAHNNGAKEATA